MSDLQFTTEFSEAIAAISNDIAQNPKKYKQAGEWLNQYHDKDFCQQKMLELSDKIIDRYFISDEKGSDWRLPEENNSKHFQIMTILQSFALVEFGEFIGQSEMDYYMKTETLEVLEKDFTKESFIATASEFLAKRSNRCCDECKKVVPLKYRLWLACKQLLLIQERCKFVGYEDSKRICLVTWLLTEPDVNIQALDLTEFEKWEWYSSDENIYPQRAKAIQLLNEYDISKNWQAITCQAWQKVKNGSEAKTDKNNLKRRGKGVLEEQVKNVLKTEPSLTAKEIADLLNKTWAGKHKPTTESSVGKVKTRLNRNAG